MIKVEDLRIGNWVEYKGEVYQVFNGLYKGCCDLDSEILDQNIPHVSLENIRGVKLREEILLKLGFLNWNGYYSKGDIKYEEESIILNFWSDDSYVIKGIKHLHQLQNLYWCLTGEELNIEL